MSLKGEVVERLHILFLKCLISFRLGGAPRVLVWRRCGGWVPWPVSEMFFQKLLHVRFFLSLADNTGTPPLHGVINTVRAFYCRKPIDHAAFKGFVTF